MAPAPDFTLRHASVGDIAELEALIADSARGLSRGHYTPVQIEAALGTAWGVDSELIRDETYFVVEVADRIVACGGWSRRKTLFGGDRQAGRRSDLLDPARDSARIRAFFVRPDHARQGIGRMLLERCEADAIAHGFRSAELVSTLPGRLLYAAHGYAGSERVAYPLAEGVAIDFVPMRKQFSSCGNPSLADGDIVIRPFAPEDVASSYAAACESIDTVGPWMPWCHAGYALDEAAAWVELCRKNWAEGVSCEFGIFGAASNEVWGGVGVNSINRVNNYANLGYWVRASRTGRGVATRAARLAAQFAFRELGLARIEIVILPDNAGSRAVAAKLGARYECIARNRHVVRGQSLDAAVYSLVPADVPDESRVREAPGPD